MYHAHFTFSPKSYLGIIVRFRTVVKHKDMKIAPHGFPCGAAYFVGRCFALSCGIKPIYYNIFFAFLKYVLLPNPSINFCAFHTKTLIFARIFGHTGQAQGQIPLRFGLCPVMLLTVLCRGMSRPGRECRCRWLFLHTTFFFAQSLKIVKYVYIVIAFCFVI